MKQPSFLRHAIWTIFGTPNDITAYDCKQCGKRFYDYTSRKRVFCSKTCKEHNKFFGSEQVRNCGCGDADCLKDL